MVLSVVINKASQAFKNSMLFFIGIVFIGLDVCRNSFGNCLKHLDMVPVVTPIK